MFLSVVTDCLIWAFLTLGILWLVQRCPFGQGKWLRSLLVHVVACLGSAALATILSALAAEVIRKEMPPGPRSQSAYMCLILYFEAKLNNSIASFTVPSSRWPMSSITIANGDMRELVASRNWRRSWHTERELTKS